MREGGRQVEQVEQVEERLVAQDPAQRVDLPVRAEPSRPALGVADAVDPRLHAGPRGLVQRAGSTFTVRLPPMPPPHGR
ncbi:hypothetical protein ACGFNU_08640 [Spirillospora sp. NPDC048911]|uniref:hypothetical protein n=1 Tax=Spirillospora sp. NPDC048911 TaxID=3364527 RepID=UPI003718B170